MLMLSEELFLRAAKMVMLLRRRLSPNFALSPSPRSKKRQSPSSASTAAAAAPSTNCG